MDQMLFENTLNLYSFIKNKFYKMENNEDSNHLVVYVFKSTAALAVP